MTVCKCRVHFVFSIWQVTSRVAPVAALEAIWELVLLLDSVGGLLIYDFLKRVLLINVEKEAANRTMVGLIGRRLILLLGNMTVTL